MWKKDKIKSSLETYILGLGHRLSAMGQYF